jgi:uncharacterized protein
VADPVDPSRTSLKHSSRDLGVVVRIAVVGAGITGLGAAWLLSQRHEVTLFEALPRLGGHSNTVDVAAPEGTIPVDTGFIVYNEASYPNLVALFAHMGVPTAASNMSFGVSLDGGAYEYSGTGLNGMFAQRANIVSLEHWRMLADILRFHREGRALAVAAADPDLALGEWLTAQGYSQPFITRHILPMAAAIWSATADQMLAFPAQSFARFFANHGLLQAANQPTWRTVVGGSRSYVTRLLEDFNGRVVSGDPVVSVARDASGAALTTRSGGSQRFDEVALCCHADEALALLADPSPEERKVLGCLRTTTNEAVLHSDLALMPRRRGVWSSWNYLAAEAGGPLCLTYWMNSLQPLATKTNYFVTLNPTKPINPALRVQTITYTHPLFDRAALQAQAAVWGLQGQRSTWFAGSYCGYGFHEDGLQAGLAIAEAMTRGDNPVRRPWRVADESGRLPWPAASGALTAPTLVGAV